MMKKVAISICLTIIFIGCSVKIPDNVINSQKNVKIYPDYTNLTIPYNIAPLNFTIEEVADEYITEVFSKKGKCFIMKGKDVVFHEKKWKSILTEHKGDTIFLRIYLKKDGTWTKHPIIKNYIAPEPIDDYVSYRLIEPGYNLYNEISICQRNITNFQEKTIYNNGLVSTDTKGQCVNCHSFQNYNQTGKIQMHFRGEYSGTLVTVCNKLEKVNLKTDSTITGGIYPSWHPTLDIVVYSVNKINQTFHTKDIQKIEVHDKESGLIMYNIKKNEVRKIIDNPNTLETFPYWSPDGKTLFFASADYEPEMDNLAMDLAMNYKNVKYNLLKISFNTETLEFGKVDTVFNASVIDKSATFPRLSPDGKYLLFTMGDYGNFHIWHKSSDLYILDMETNKTRNLKEINSPEPESYHSWSSNGHWIIFSSRRENGGYTRFYLSHFNGKGRFDKAFVLPQKNPDFYPLFLKSFNVPEFLTDPVDFSPHNFVKAIKSKGKLAVFGQ